MSPRPTMPISFGGGVDRLSGLTAVDPSQSIDLRNVHLGPGRMELRRGLGSPLAIGWGTDTIAIVPVKKTGLDAVVVYDSVSRDVRLYSTDGATVSLVGTVFTVNVAVAGHVPRVSVGEAYSTILIAHDEPLFQYRSKTRVFDVTESTLSDLVINQASVYFRGVATHLAYMIGWGYGTADDPDRPETLRISAPGDPRSFDKQAYFLVGSPSDPIIMGRPRGNDFVIGKPSELWRLVGYDRLSFGIAPMDQNFGPATSRAHVELNGELFFWSLSGPRATTGGASGDLSPPLDLPGPVPDAGAALNENIFAWHDPVEHEVVFCFGTFGYVLHLRAEPRQWSYRTFGLELNSAGLLFSSTGTGKLNPITATIGTVVANSPSYAAGDDDPSFTVPWTTSGAGTGTEVVEVWGKHATIDRGGRAPFGTHLTGSWTKLGQAAATAGTVTVRVPYYLTTWTLAVRVISGNTPGHGFTGSPDSWPATALTTKVSGGAITSFGITGIWERRGIAEHGQPFAYVGPGSSGASHPELLYKYEQSTNAGSTWQLHDSVASSVPSRGIGQEDQFAHGIYAAPLLGSIHSNADRLKHVLYRLSVIGPAATVGPTSATAEAVLGPQKPTISLIGPDTSELTERHLHPITVVAGAHGGSIEVRARHDPDGSWSTTYTVPSGVVEAVVLLDNTGGADNVRAEAVTHISTSNVGPGVQGPGVMSIDDYSEAAVGTASF